MAILKYKYNALSEVPEKYVELYEEKDGKAILRKDAIDEVKTQADIDRILGAHKKEREAREKAELTLKKFEALADKEPEEITAMVDELEELRAAMAEGGKGKSEAAKELVDAKKQIRDLSRERDKLKKDHDGYKAQAEELGGKIKRSTLEGALTKVANQLKVRPEAVDDILRYQDVFELGDDGVPRTRDGVGVTPGLGAEEWLGEMKDKRPHWWPDSVGGGARGGSGGGMMGDNPFAKGSMNLTKAGQLMQADATKAANMARAAGFPSAEAAIAAMATAQAMPAAPTK